MKKNIVFLLLFFSYSAFSQTLPNFKEIKLDKAVDFKKAETNVLQTVNYVLSTPYKKNNDNYLNALQFIITWTSGTPDYNFTLDNIASKVTKGNNNLQGILMACITKYYLENKSLAKDQNLVKLNSVKTLLAYCENQNNNIKLTKQLKKLSEANQKGELEKEL